MCNNSTQKNMATVNMALYPKSLVQTIVNYLYTGVMEKPPKNEYGLFEQLLDEYGLLPHYTTNPEDLEIIGKVQVAREPQKTTFTNDFCIGKVQVVREPQKLTSAPKQTANILEVKLKTEIKQETMDIDYATEGPSLYDTDNGVNVPKQRHDSFDNDDAHEMEYTFNNYSTHDDKKGGHERAYDGMDCDTLDHASTNPNVANVNDIPGHNDVDNSKGSGEHQGMSEEKDEWSMMCVPKMVPDLNLDKINKMKQEIKAGGTIPEYSKRKMSAYQLAYDDIDGNEIKNEVEYIIVENPKNMDTDKCDVLNNDSEEKYDSKDTTNKEINRDNNDDADWILSMEKEFVEWREEHTCHLCDKGWDDFTKLMDHFYQLKGYETRSYKPKEQKEKGPYPCRECGKVFAREDYLVAHMRIHTGEMIVSCRICRRSFNQLGTLKYHLQIHNPGNNLLLLHLLLLLLLLLLLFLSQVIITPYKQNF